MLNGATLADFDIGPNITQIALGEMLAGDVYQRFLELYFKLTNASARTTNQFLRRKRNYPLDYRGVQHKDVTYNRGRFEVRGYLLNDGDFASLFISQVDLQDMRMLLDDLSSSQKNQLHYNQFLAERLLRELQGNHYTFDAFRSYLTEKYPFIDFTTYPLHVPTLEQEQIVQEMKEILGGE